MAERIHLRGTREEKIETARLIKSEMQEFFPDMVDLHAQLTELGMCTGTIADIGILKTPNVVYNKYQDNPGHLTAKFNAPTYADEEIQHAVQARTLDKIGAARSAPDSRSRYQRR